MVLVFLLKYLGKIKLLADGGGCVCVCACGELVVGKVVGFLLHVHVWASE